jgi:hypothetical protein
MMIFVFSVIRNSPGSIEMETGAGIRAGTFASSEGLLPVQPESIIMIAEMKYSIFSMSVFLCYKYIMVRSLKKTIAAKLIFPAMRLKS